MATSENQDVVLAKVDFGNFRIYSAEEAVLFEFVCPTLFFILGLEGGNGWDTLPLTNANGNQGDGTHTNLLYKYYFITCYPKNNHEDERWVLVRMSVVNRIGTVAITPDFCVVGYTIFSEKPELEKLDLATLALGFPKT